MGDSGPYANVRFGSKTDLGGPEALELLGLHINPVGLAEVRQVDDATLRALRLARIAVDEVTFSIKAKLSCHRPIVIDFGNDTGQAP